jgi:hypothetical protein
MQAEYEHIQRDLSRLLIATEYTTFQQLHPGLQRALNDMGGYTNAQSEQLTASERVSILQNLQEIAQKMTGRIFRGDHHIFYLRVVQVRDAGGNLVLPPRHLAPIVTDRNADYMVQEACRHNIDITNLHSTNTPQLIPLLYLYQRYQEVDDFIFMRPFTLWAPPQVETPARGMVSLTWVEMIHFESEHDYQLREENGTVVLTVEFNGQSVHGAQAMPAQSGMHMSSLLLQLHECGEGVDNLVGDGGSNS